MSIKSLIQSLYKLSGSQAMPSAQVIEVSNFGTDIVQYTAPTDGYACVQYNGRASSVECDIQVSGKLRSIASNNNGWTSVFCPCKKGDTIYYRSTGDTATARLFRFVSTIGAS